MQTFPNCKINLGLRVVGKRPDGYHNLETLFLPIPLCDSLQIEHASQFSFVQEGITLDNIPEDNLCVKAYRLLQSQFPQMVKPVRMRLEKHIPFGAGLGGGSSDAAFTLKMISEMFHLPCTVDELELLSAQIGADCAFFVRNQAAYATGIGDQLEPLDLDLSPYRFVLLKPSDKVSTKEAYSGIVPRQDDSRLDLRQAVKLPVEEWKHHIANDFETSVFPNHPRIAALKQQLYDAGALYASMSGSGAAVFGLFPKDAPVNLDAIPADEIIYDEL